MAFRPRLGNLTRVGGVIPHPQSEVAVSLELVKGGLVAEVNLPAGVTGDFVWQGRKRPLVADKSKLTF